MTEPRRPRRPVGAAGRIRKLEERLARLEAELRAARAQGAARRGAAQARLRVIERAVGGQIERAQAALKDSAGRLQRALADAQRRRDVAAQVARARVALRESLDRLGVLMAGSQKTVKRELNLLGRALRAGVKAGSAAYRRKRS